MTATEVVYLLSLGHASMQILCHTSAFHLSACDEESNTVTTGKLRHGCTQWHRQDLNPSSLILMLAPAGLFYVTAMPKSRDFFNL